MLWLQQPQETNTVTHALKWCLQNSDKHIYYFISKSQSNINNIFYIPVNREKQDQSDKSYCPGSHPKDVGVSEDYAYIDSVMI